MIKGILFDIDGVLLDSKAANVLFYQDLIEKAGYERPAADEVFRHFHLTIVDTIRVLVPKATDEEVKRIRKIALDERIYKNDLVEIPKDARKILRQLSKKYKIGIVTGRAKMGVDIFFEIFKERDLFSEVIHYEMYFKPKPDPEPILMAAEKLGLKPSEILYVGDSLTDLAAANAAGTHFVDYSTNKIPVVGSPNHIESLSELPKLLNKLS